MNIHHHHRHRRRRRRRRHRLLIFAALLSLSLTLFISVCLRCTSLFLIFFIVRLRVIFDTMRPNGKE
jgi:hypothetical protein